MLGTAVLHPPVPATRTHTHGHTPMHMHVLYFSEIHGVDQEADSDKGCDMGFQDEAWRRIKSIILILLKRTSNFRGGQGGTGHVTALSPNFSTKWCLLVGKKKEKIKGFLITGFKNELIN